MSKVLSTKCLIAAAALSVFISSPVLAEGWYAGALYTQTNLDTSGYGDAKPSVVSVKLGVELNKNLAVEGRIGGSASGDSVTLLGQSVDVKISDLYGVYLKGILPISDTFSFYGLAGYTHGKATASIGNISASNSKGSGSLGIGLEVLPTKNIVLSVEWAKYYSDLDGLSLGVAYKF